MMVRWMIDTTTGGCYQRKQESDLEYPLHNNSPWFNVASRLQMIDWGQTLEEVQLRGSMRGGPACPGQKFVLGWCFDHNK